jgi:hypothetical protein
MNRNDAAKSAKNLLENKPLILGYRLFRQEETDWEGKKSSFFYLRKKWLLLFWRLVYLHNGSSTYRLATFPNEEEARKWALSQQPPKIKTEEFPL